MINDYVKTRIFQGGSVEILVLYFNPVTLDVLIREMFVCDINTLENPFGGVSIYTF
jgi:hypothetical protein